MTASALDGVLVLDLSAAVSGGFAGKLLADLGAQVVMIEPPEGTGLREHGLFDYLAGGKQSVVPSDAADFGRWLGAADIVLTDGSSPWHGTVVGDRPDRTVVVDLSPFGRSGPYAEWNSSDLVTWAMGGYLYFTGSPDREPIWLPGPHARDARRRPCRVRRPRRVVRARSARPRATGGGGRPRRRAHRPRVAGGVVGGVRYAAREAAG